MWRVPGKVPNLRLWALPGVNAYELLCMLGITYDDYCDSQFTQPLGDAM